MIWELADITITPGTNEQFEAAVAEAAPLFARADGCHDMQLRHSIESPERYLLVVQWETVEHHTVNFRSSEDFTAWRKLAGPFFAAPPTVEHLELAVPAEGTS